MRVHRLGAVIGNFNDKHSRHDSSAEATLRWRMVDRIASWLYQIGPEQ